MYEEISVSLNPYLCSSENLIEFFAIIGYDEKLLENSQNIEEDEKNFELSVISTIISDKVQNKINFQDIINKVYPDKPEIIKKNDLDYTMPKQSSVIFSSCIDSVNGKQKIFYSCYALTFHEKYMHTNKKEYYIPRAFLIYSQYPYFTTFYNICFKLYIIKEFYIEEQIPIEIFIYCLVNRIPSPIGRNLILKDFKPNIFIPKLTGFPFIDFNLCNIFNSIPIKEFIKIYILVFLELDLLFFSQDIEELNLFMYILYILNYPLTDSNYFWHIKSISKNDIIELSNKTLITLFLGVNAEYNSNINLKPLKNVNFIVDLGNKKHLVNVSKNKESEEINKIIKYIDNILNHKKVKSYFLLDCVLTLKHKLKSIKKEYETKLNKNNSPSFFYVDNNVIQTNKQIQEAFYNFILKIIKVLSKDYHYDYSTLSIIKNKNNKNNELSDEEDIFLKYFRYTIKYTVYYDNFISYFRTVDEFKISLLFFDEFVNIKTKYKNNEIPIDIQYFQIIDNLYILKKGKDLNNLNYLNEENKEFLLACKQYLLNVKNEKKNQLFALDQKIIDNFLSHKNDFEFLKLINTNENNEMKINKIKLINITSTIQKFCNKFLNKEYFVKSSIVYIFSFIFPLFRYNNNILFLTTLLYSLENIKYFQRYYINILLKSINNYYIVNKEKFHFPELTLQNIASYCELIKGHLIKDSIIPNEEIFNFFKNIRAAEKNKTEDINNDNINNKNIFIYQYYKEENYINAIKDNKIIILDENMLIFTFNGNKTKYRLIPYNMILKLIFSMYQEYLTIYNFNIEKLDFKHLINIIINIIYYLFCLDEVNTASFLLNGILLLQKFQEDLKIFKEKNNENNNGTDLNINNNNINLINIDNNDDNNLNINNNKVIDNNNNI